MNSSKVAGTVAWLVVPVKLASSCLEPLVFRFEKSSRVDTHIPDSLTLPALVPW